MELPERKDYSKFDEDGVQLHDRRGAEMPDPVPMAPPLGYQKPLSMFDAMRAQIRQEHSRLRELELEQLSETPEQASDFNVEEDIENMPSLYEEKFDPVDFELRSRLRQAEFRASVLKAAETLSDKHKELLSGDDQRSILERSSDVDARRNDDDRGRSRQRDKERESEPEPQSDASGKRGVSASAGSSGTVKGKGAGD